MARFSQGDEGGTTPASPPLSLFDLDDEIYGNIPIIQRQSVFLRLLPQIMSFNDSIPIQREVLDFLKSSSNLGQDQGDAGERFFHVVDHLLLSHDPRIVNSTIALLPQLLGDQPSPESVIILMRLLRVGNRGLNWDLDDLRNWERLKNTYKAIAHALDVWAQHGAELPFQDNDRLIAFLQRSLEKGKTDPRLIEPAFETFVGYAAICSTRLKDIINIARYAFGIDKSKNGKSIDEELSSEGKEFLQNKVKSAAEKILTQISTLETSKPHLHERYSALFDPVLRVLPRHEIRRHITDNR